MTRRFGLTIACECADWNPPGHYARLIRLAIAQTFGHLAPPGGYPSRPCVGYRLVNDRRMRIINRDWRGFDKPTNVLSFPQMVSAPSSGPWIVGDCVLAFETLAHEAKVQNKAVDDHFQHLVVHGLLHLLGYDHETPHDTRLMQRLERDILARLGIDNPYA